MIRIFRNEKTQNGEKLANKFKNVIQLLENRQTIIWTEEENEMLLRGVELYGKNITKVQKFIGTKTYQQTYTQFRKLEENIEEPNDNFNYSFNSSDSMTGRSLLELYKRLNLSKNNSHSD